MLKEVTGRSVSSSSLWIGDGGLSGTVEPSEMNERCEMVFEAKRACLAWLIGDDSGRLCWLFQDAVRDATRGLRLLVAGPEVAVRWRAVAADGRDFLLL